jgi:hypothetical protein
VDSSTSTTTPQICTTPVATGRVVGKRRRIESLVRRPAHSRIAKKGRPAGKNLLVGRLHMGLGADHRGNLAVQGTPQRDFLARRLA